MLILDQWKSTASNVQWQQWWDAVQTNEELLGDALRERNIKDDGRIAGQVVDVARGGIHKHHLPVRPDPVA